MQTLQTKQPLTTDGKLWGGVVIIITGVLFLVKQYNPNMPDWTVSWPIWFIITGLYLNARQNFASGWGYFMLIFGAINLTEYIVPTFDSEVLFGPALLICGGLWTIFHRKIQMRRLNTED